MIAKEKNSYSAVSRMGALIAAASVAMTIAQPLHGQIGTAPGVALINPRGVVFSPATRKVYSVDEAQGLVHVSDDERGSTVSVRVGSRPVSIAVNDRTGMAYVANSGDGTVSVIDGKSDSVVATVQVGSQPYAIAANSTTGAVYVSRTYSDQITKIDGATNAPAGIKTGSADFLAVDVKTDTLYLTGYESGAVSMLSGASGTLVSKEAGMHLWGITMDERTGTAYVARAGSADVAALRAGSAAPLLIATGNIPCAGAVNSRTGRVYIVNYDDDSVTVIDGATERVIATIRVGEHPEAVAIDAMNNLIYVANTHANSVTVIDGATNQVLTTLPAGKNPYALAVNPYAGKLHVANLDQRSFTIINVKNIDVKNIQKALR